MLWPKQIERDFIVLSPDKKAAIEPADATLYQRLDDTYDGFKAHELISCYEFESDWNSWEIHPKGDEIVILMSGKVEFVLEAESGVETVLLEQQGQYLVVPKGVWHTAKTVVKSKVLFITPGEKTRHKPE